MHYWYKNRRVNRNNQCQPGATKPVSWQVQLLLPRFSFHFEVKVKQKNTCMQIKRMLVLTELNQPSEISLEFAADLAAHLGVREVVLLNVVLSVQQQARSANQQSNLSLSPELVKLLDKEIQQKRKAIILKQAKAASSERVKILPYIEFDQPDYHVNDYMKKYRADLLVCGSKEKESFLKIIFGSSAEKKTEKLKYPMIVLSDEPSTTDIQTIALALDIKDTHQQGVDEIVDFSRMLNAHLQLLHIMVSPDESTKGSIDVLHEFAKSKNLENYSINLLSSNAVEDGLESFVTKAKPDMIALVNPGKGKLDRMIFGDKINPSETETALPVFICKTG